MKTEVSLVLFLLAVILLFGCADLFAQNASDKPLNHQMSDKILKRVLGSDFESEGIFNVDKILAKPTIDRSVAYIREDPNHQLQHAFIVEYAKWDSAPPEKRFGSGVTLNDTAGIALIRDSNIVWYSNRFIPNYNPLTCQISGFADLNGDGITDIIISQFDSEQQEYEYLWILTPDDHGGRILNTVDRDGYSDICGKGDTFTIVNSKNSKIKKIHSSQGYYEWNGSIFKKTVH